MTVTRVFSSAAEVVRLDWYSGSLVDFVESDRVVAHLAMALDGSPRPGIPRHGYRSCAQIMRGDQSVAVVMWGGQNPTPFVQGSGESAVSVAKIMRERWSHRVSRVDACLDFDHPNAWEDVSGMALKVARERGIKKRLAGDWLDPHQGPGEGRTLMLGATSAAVQGRTYEKGMQLPEAGRPDWVRAEVQVRPQKASKALLATVSPLEVWGASAWSADLLERLTGDQVPPARVVTWREPDGARAYAAMLRQYGRTLERLAEAYGWPSDGFGPVILSDLERLRQGEVI